MSTLFDDLAKAVLFVGVVVLGWFSFSDLMARFTLNAPEPQVQISVDTEELQTPPSDLGDSNTDGDQQSEDLPDSLPAEQVMEKRVNPIVEDADSRPPERSNSMRLGGDEPWDYQPQVSPKYRLEPKPADDVVLVRKAMEKRKVPPAKPTVISTKEKPKDSFEALIVRTQKLEQRFNQLQR